MPKKLQHSRNNQNNAVGPSFDPSHVNFRVTFGSTCDPQPISRQSPSTTACFVRALCLVLLSYSCKMPGSGQDTLVKYETPVLVSTGATLKRRTSGAPAAPASPTKGLGQSRKLPPVEGKPQLSQTEDILNQILPPREWSEEGQFWVQRVSPSPATRLDVINLQEALDAKLKERQARETGIDPIRQELYGQAFGKLKILQEGCISSHV